jgi:hypothetical protein
MYLMPSTLFPSSLSPVTYTWDSRVSCLQPPAPCLQSPAPLPSGKPAAADVGLASRRRPRSSAKPKKARDPPSIRQLPPCR